MANLDPIEVLNMLADSCGPSEDAAFWILTSAATRLADCGGGGSMVAHFFPEVAAEAKLAECLDLIRQAFDPMIDAAPEFDPDRPAAVKSIP